MSKSERNKKMVLKSSCAKKRKSIEERLLDGEEIIQQSVIHIGIFWKAVAILIIAALVGFFIVKELGVLLLITAAIMAFYALIKKEILLLVITNKRVFARYGILQVDVVDIHLDKIESLELERMIPGFIMGYANVVIMGTGNRYIVIPYVGNAVALRRAYNQIALGEGAGAKTKKVKQEEDS